MTEGINTEGIRTSFEQMQTKEDLLNLLNKAKPFLYGKGTVPFELKQLTWYANPKLSRSRYVEFAIKKKSGASRSIHAPVKGLKAIQKSLALILQCVFEPHKAAMGFTKGKSIVDNALVHHGNNYVYNIDLKDFFPSIDQARVWRCLQLRPFNLNDGSPRTESDNLRKVNTGIRKFETEFGESVSYEIRNNYIILITDSFGNYNRYKQRIAGYYPAPDVDPNSKDLGDIAKLKEYEDRLYTSILEDAQRYILTSGNVKQILRLAPSRLNLASIIASLCCTEMDVERINSEGSWETVKRNVLPQGAPTSPIITNIICQRLDYLLSGVAKRFGLKYSRYADDITFSSMHNVYQSDGEFLKELHRIIAEQGFHIKESKTRLQKNGYRKEVTGLLVNDKVNVQSRYVKQLRMWLYYWERYGYDWAYGFFIQQYKIDKGHVKKGKPDMANVISGKLDYLKMVKGSENKMYLSLKERLKRLLRVEDPILKILNAWEQEGIEKAMESFDLLEK
jgi:retron-type reverse transcriptase